MFKKKNETGYSDPHNRRTRQINLTLTEEEYNTFREKMEKYNFHTMMGYVRTACLYPEKWLRKSKTVEALKDIKNELNKQGANLNQIALRLNSDKSKISDDTLREIDKMQDELVDTIRKVKTTLAKARENM